MHPRTDMTNRFPLFKQAVESVKDKKILDFGGNRGNLLYFSEGEINQTDYFCIDVESDSIENGKNEFPDATFLHWNKFSPMYNHNGNKDEPLPVLDIKFDIAFAFSVITHTDWQEFKLYVKYLMQYAKKIIISFIDIDNIQVKEYFYKKRCDEYGNCVDFRKINDCDYFYLVNNSAVIKDTEVYKEKCKHFINFYRPSFLENEFQSNIIHSIPHELLLINS